jgi:shikimate dehydrogenase
VTRPVTGATRVAGIIGDPVAHSRSPAIHNAAYAATNLDWVFVAMHVPRGAAHVALEGVRALDIAGLSVTMPHKSDAASACDELSPAAEALGAVNVVVARDRRLFGDSTDGEGLVRSVQDQGVDVRGTPAVVLGAGGAARAITRALGAAGADVTVAARRIDAAAETAALAGGATGVALGDLRSGLPAGAVLVNATPVGMQGEPPPVDPGLLDGLRLVVDTIYHPAETALVVAARERGVAVVNGLGMLVHQAALAFELMTSCPAPLAAMREAAEA